MPLDCYYLKAASFPLLIRSAIRSAIEKLGEACKATGKMHPAISN